MRKENKLAALLSGAKYFLIRRFRRLTQIFFNLRNPRNLRIKIPEFLIYLRRDLLLNERIEVFSKTLLLLPNCGRAGCGRDVCRESEFRAATGLRSSTAS
jgi:hypothetical protein